MAFGAGALVMLGISAFHAWWLPRFEVERTSSAIATPGAVWRGYARAFSTYLEQDRVALVLVFIVLYRVGDEILFSMTTPFLMRELGVTKGQYAWLAGFVGAAGTIIGTMLGGWWIKARGLGRRSGPSPCS